MSSVAPNACCRNSISRGTSRTTRYGVTVRYPSGIGFTALPPLARAAGGRATRLTYPATPRLPKSTLDAVRLTRPARAATRFRRWPFVLLCPLALARFGFDVFRRADLDADLRVDLRADDREPRFLAMRDLRAVRYGSHCMPGRCP